VTVRFVADENFNRAILVGVQRRAEHIDIVRVQDVGLRTADDPVILQWAADEGRVLVTHDIKTIPDFAHERVSAGLPMAGVLIVRSALPIAVVIDELVTIESASDPDDWKDAVHYLPLL
jgi:predicted nuclease of predicted toxin-antitoxin system